MSAVAVFVCFDYRCEYSRQAFEGRHFVSLVADSNRGSIVGRREKGNEMRGKKDEGKSRREP